MHKPPSISIIRRTSFKFFCLLFCWSLVSYSQTSFSQSEVTINEFISGTLLLPTAGENPDIVLLIQGSGPTDRDGNQPFLRNDSMKKLALALGEEGIGSFRFDKRIAAMQRLNLKEEDMHFDDFVTDAQSAISYIKENVPHNNLIIIGHSQGSLVGMLASRDKADAFISIAGAGQPIDSIIVDQLKMQMPGLDESAREAFAKLRRDGEVSDFNPFLASIFRPQIQSFMLSWMKYDPAKELQKLEIPVLIIGGTRDLQVNLDEGQKLQESVPAAILVDLEDMNHILTQVSEDPLENQKSYNEPSRPLHPELVPVVLDFIKNLPNGSSEGKQ